MVSRRGIGWSGLLAAMVLALVPATALFAFGQNKDQSKDKKGDQKQQSATAQAQAQEVQNLVHIADTAMMGQQVPSDFPIEFQSDFLRAQAGRVWIPMTLSIDSARLSNPAGEPATLYVRVAPRGMTAPPPPAPANDKDKKKKDDKQASAAPSASYPFEDVSFLELKPAAAGQPVRILRGVGVPPGSYDVYLVLRERGTATPKAAVLKQPLEVPNYTGQFSTSSIILAERVETLTAAITPEQQSEHPYAFGQTEIVVSPDHKFRKAEELIVLLQIYNPVITADKKFNLEATYTFFRHGPDGDKRFNSTEPQSFTPESMGAGFDPSGADRSIQAGQGIPLQSFPAGDYRLEIKITDKLADPAKVLTQAVTFTVTE